MRPGTSSSGTIRGRTVKFLTGSSTAGRGDGIFRYWSRSCRRPLAATDPWARSSPRATVRRTPIRGPHWSISLRRSSVTRRRITLRSGHRTKTGIRYLLPSPRTGSACKRMNLYIRWMVRRDALDLGLWKTIPPSGLVMPIDTHVARISRRLGLTSGARRIGRWPKKSRGR